jgi:DNA polymerase-3 subunit alpha
MASLMTSDQQNIDRIAIEVEEAKEMGITVLPPDINESYTTFTAVFDQQTKTETKKIRFGLLAIKNIGEDIVRTIVHDRKEHGHFTSLENFLTRVQSKNLNKKSLQSLFESGAMDRFGERKQLLSNIEVILRFAKHQNDEQESRQSSLFGSLPRQAPTLTLEPSEPATRKEKLNWEKHLLGLYISEHPVRRLHATYGKRITPISTILHDETLPERSSLTLLGVIASAKRILTRSMDPMLFVKLEDHTGSVEAIVFPKILRQYPTYWEDNTIVMVSGRYSEKNGEKKFIVETARIIQDDIQEICIRIPTSLNKNTFARIQDILKSSPGQLPVRFIVENGTGPKTINTPFKIHFTEELKTALQSLVGKNNLLIE